MELNLEDYRFLIHRALSEDLGRMGDITSQAIFQSETATAAVYAKQKGVLAGIEIAKNVFRMIDSRCQFGQNLRDGAAFKKGECILSINGSVFSLLKSERTALNFLGRLSGIATMTNKFVNAIRNTRCQILDTRKTTPGWRILEKYAVKTGGGTNHRMGLYDMVLIKDNHITAAKGITAAVEKVRGYLQQNHILAEIEVEVSNLDELQEAISLKVNRIMLDNMNPIDMKQAVEICNGKIPLEASGNVQLGNVVEIAQAGVDYISIGSLTHSAPACDFSMLIE